MMHPLIVLLADIIMHKSSQMPFVEHDDVIEKLLSTTAYKALGNAVLPWTSECSANGLHIQTLLGMTYLTGQSFRPVSATLAINHFPSVQTRLNRSVPQWSTFPSVRNSNGAHTTARS
jgi:hypothetical protein